MLYIQPSTDFNLSVPPAFRDFRSYSTHPALHRAVVEAESLLQRCAPQLGPEDLSRVSKAVSIAFEIHREPGETGEPYIYHPLDVARTLVESLGVHNADAIISALFHDGPEDEAKKIIALLSAGQLPETIEQQQSMAASLLAKCCSANLRSEGVIFESLIGLTNPDFRAIMRSFVDLYSEIPLAEGAQHLLDHACVASPEPVHTFRNTYELRNRLYLGHVVDLLLNDGKKESSSLAAVVKLADFAVNGLSLDQLDKQIRSEFLLKQVPFFRAKYGPVVRYLDTWIDTDTARAALPMEARHWLRTLISENLAGVYSQHRDADHAVIQVLPNIDVALCYKLETVLRHSAAAANASVLLARSHHHRDGFHLNMQDVPQRVLVDSLGSIFPTIVIGNSGALARRIANMFQFVWRVIPPATSSQLLPRDPGQFEVGIELLERGVPLVSITQSLDTSRPAQVYVRDSEGAFKQRSL